MLHGRFRKLIWLLAVVVPTASLGFAKSTLTISPSSLKQLKNSSVQFSASINGAGGWYGDVELVESGGGNHHRHKRLPVRGRQTGGTRLADYRK